MKIATAWSTKPDAYSAATEAHEMLLDRLGGVPQLMLVHSSCNYDSEILVHRLRSLAPGIPIQGGTSCLGVMTESGFHSKAGLGLGIMGVLDPDGAYGAGIVKSKKGHEATTAIDQALKNAARPGELPAAVIISNYPGYEERVIQTIENYLGADVPIIGGTAADNDMSGQWRQFANDTVLHEGISVATIFPSGNIGYTFHSGYEPTDCKGRVTRAEDRILYEIDDRPAAQVYNEWTEGLIEHILPKGGSLLPTTAFKPIGRPVGRVGGIPYFRLSYPVEALPDGGLLVFTDIKEGDEVFQMTGTHDSLVNRAGRVAMAAMDAAPFKAEEVQGALVLFCAGCMLAIQDRMHEVVADLQAALNGAPFLGAFTLGEQGCFIGGENRHGNLMIAVLVLGPLSKE